ncbi:MAG: hypothetical protein WBE89_11070 [Methyloceanibacter sp.]
MAALPHRVPAIALAVALVALGTMVQAQEAGTGGGGDVAMTPRHGGASNFAARVAPHCARQQRAVGGGTKGLLHCHLS